MSVRAKKATGRDQDRQQLIEELKTEQGPDWAKGYKPGSFGCHELLDRTSLIAGMVEEHVLNHPACARNRDWYALAEKAAAALHELYQRVGAEHLDDKDTNTA